MKVTIFAMAMSVPAVTVTGTAAMESTRTAIGPDSWVPLGVFAAALITAIGLAWKFGGFFMRLESKQDHANDRLGKLENQVTSIINQRHPCTKTRIINELARKNGIEPDND